eukprot:7538631-Prorocentrum_lima.AAC.1
METCPMRLAQTLAPLASHKFRMTANFPLASTVWGDRSHRAFQVAIRSTILSQVLLSSRTNHGSERALLKE